MGITHFLRRPAGRRALAAAVTASRGEMPAGLLPPSRAHVVRSVTTTEALSLGTVYRALDILTTAVGQLGIEVTRNGSPVAATARPSVVRNPSVNIDRRTFIEQTVMSLATAGNFFWFVDRHPAGLSTLEVLDPAHVFVELKQDGKRSYHYRGHEYEQWNIIHRAFNMPAGSATGLGPIQAAQADLRGAIDVRDYAANYFDGSGQPSGVLSTEQALTEEQAAQYRNGWNELDESGQPRNGTPNPSHIKVLGKGLSYDPILVAPKDAQWIESRNLSTVEIARLFGVPASLMLASIDGNSQTYQNVEQDWLGFTRFTLQKYLGKIEDAFTEVTDTGVEVRFNVESLLRSDTKTRYEGHTLALSAGWMTPDEVRQIEGLPELTGAQRGELSAANADRTQARELAELVQKIYLGVGTVVNQDEARAVLASAGFPLDDKTPVAQEA